jgi:hypothetical protein
MLKPLLIPSGKCYLQPLVQTFAALSTTAVPYWEVQAQLVTLCAALLAAAARGYDPATDSEYTLDEWTQRALVAVVKDCLVGHAKVHTATRKAALCALAPSCPAQLLPLFVQLLFELPAQARAALLQPTTSSSVSDVLARELRLPTRGGGALQLQPLTGSWNALTVAQCVEGAVTGSATGAPLERMSAEHVQVVAAAVESACSSAGCSDASASGDEEGPPPLGQQWCEVSNDATLCVDYYHVHQHLLLATHCQTLDGHGLLCLIWLVSQCL